MPSCADHYLAKNGYEAQKHNGMADRTRPNDVLHPVAGGHGAHGAFDDRAASWSVEAGAEEHARVLGLALLGIGLGAEAWSMLRARAK